MGKLSSISPTLLPDIPDHRRSQAAAVAKVGRRHVEQIVDGYLQKQHYRYSPEYRLGMIDALCQRTFGIGLLIRYKRGTVQADAHWAGLEHGWGLSIPAREGSE